MHGPRLRQLVIAAKHNETIDLLRETLQLGNPFVDPGVAEFGLTNAVFAIGDQFLEVVVPVSPSAPAKRFIDRAGEGGYMAIFQVDSIEKARERIDALGIRRVWDIDLEDIAASHLHPADTGGAIMSLDTPKPVGAWRWGGPDWAKHSVTGGIRGAAVQSPSPEALAARWASVLGTEIDTSGESTELAQGNIRFEQGYNEGVTQFHLELPDHPKQTSGELQIGSLTLKW
ncbi:MAG: VOC family protein [Pseudomonadota bacterium]